MHMTAWLNFWLGRWEELDLTEFVKKRKKEKKQKEIEEQRRWNCGSHNSCNNVCEKKS